VRPDQSLTLVFEISSSEVAEVAVEENVDCTITFPNGETREPCSGSADLANVHTAGSGKRHYAFPDQGPD